MTALRVPEDTALRYANERRAMPEHGQLILIAKDDRAVRFHVWQLVAHSFVFRDMIGTHTEEITIRVPDADSSALAVLRSHLDTDAPPNPLDDTQIAAKNFPSVLDALELCERYDMNLVGRQLLDRALDNIVFYEGWYVYKTFVWASKYNSIELAVKIIMEGPDTYAQPDAHMPGTMHFNRTVASLIRPDWVWALKHAEAELVMRKGDLSSLENWKRFAGAFVQYLL